MRARYRNVEAAAAGGSTVRVRCELGNPSSKAWSSRAGYHVGWQIYDPATQRFLIEGEWAPLAMEVGPRGETGLDVAVQLPAEDGPYRVYLSPLQEQDGWFYTHGSPLVVVDAHVAQGCAQVDRARVTTIRDLRRESALRSLPGLMRAPFESVWEHRGLITSLARRDVLARYRGSFGDVLWTLLNPLLLMATYFFVFGVVLNTRFSADQNRTGFALYFLAGMLPWLAFSEPLARAPHVVLEYRNFVKKLLFPIDTLPVVQTVSGLATGVFATIVYVAALLIIRHSLPATIVWLPALLIPQALFTLGLCWLLAATGAYARDLGQVMGFLLTLWFFVTPICYPETQLPHAVLPILGKNPMFTLVRAYRAILLEGSHPEFRALWKLWVLSFAVFIGGYAWFHRLRKTFADVI